MINLTEMTLAELCLRASAEYHNRPALGMFHDGKWSDQVSYRLMGIRCRQIGSLLGQLGIAAGDRVMILAENRPEWPLAFFGIALAGAVSVPALTGFSAEQIRAIRAHADVRAICLTRTTAAKIAPQDTLENAATAAPLIFIDSIHSDDEAHITVSLNGVEQELPLRAAEHSAASNSATDTIAAAENASNSATKRTPNDLASIIYTSGTLGNSKGVMLSHANLISCASASRSLLKIHPRDRLLSVIPLAHAYECTLGMLTPIMSGACITYLNRPPSASILLPAARALRPTVIITVPLLIEKMYRSAIAPALKTSALYHCPLTRPLAIILAGKKLMQALGGSLRFFGIGGAPLSPEVETFLHAARFPYSLGYGLTEAAPLVAGAAPFRFKPHSVGSTPKGVKLRIADGEIQARGPNIMMGYYKDEEQTRRAFTQDGWLKTGDLGRMDKKGRLFIKGRLKALILGPCGENIYPEEIEELLNASQLVEDALVYPGAKGELVALVHVSETARTIAKASTQAARNALEHGMEELRTWTNKHLAAFSRLSRIEMREEPFEKTPTLKIKRYLYEPAARLG